MIVAYLFRADIEITTDALTSAKLPATYFKDFTLSY